MTHPAERLRPCNHPNNFVFVVEDCAGNLCMKCMLCGAVGPKAENGSLAITAWNNTRTGGGEDE